jgi:phosphoribosylanthranilate isomerase
VIVKICGVKTAADALAAADAGAHLLGLNFYAPSPRAITPDAARTIAEAVRAHAPGVRLIGLFVNESVDAVAHTVTALRLDGVQLSGDETPDAVRALAERVRGAAPRGDTAHGTASTAVYKAVRPRSPQEAEALCTAYAPAFGHDPRLPALLVDAYHPHLYGGTGETASEAIVRAALGCAPRVMLAGGLTPANVAERAAVLGLWGVDVASGVEPDGQPGVKDAAKMRAFCAAARAAQPA